MSNIQNIINIALAEIGYSENPANSNKTKYGEWFGLNGVAWCGIFCSWVYSKAGFQLPKIGFAKGFAGCATAVSYFKKYHTITLSPKPGDLVFFDWNADGNYDHVGLFYDWKIPFKEFYTIEGNTSLTNQSNGGQVMKRARKAANVLFVHPNILDV
ncbi:CHAP domain-containing protein [Flavobacterium sp. DG1-102-2]|uniref:CHAP domain-containing protein n=1 Tax=Flavobacterium sp. DG1-102-2 TaxID=3081663 RepID=UPI00294A505A|nr:CHAP domain-containing protein [Flavobacterium sp. DG1-102-2]MDV6169536.1 CHAP domain-containing protein [Flavobacterium sp. DG1-102-2]